MKVEVPGIQDGCWICGHGVFSVGGRTGCCMSGNWIKAHGYWRSRKYSNDKSEQNIQISSYKNARPWGGKVNNSLGTKDGKMYLLLSVRKTGVLEMRYNQMKD